MCDTELLDREQAKYNVTLTEESALILKRVLAAEKRKTAAQIKKSKMISLATKRVKTTSGLTLLNPAVSSTSTVLFNVATSPIAEDLIWYSDVPLQLPFPVPLTLPIMEIPSHDVVDVDD